MHGPPRKANTQDARTARAAERLARRAPVPRTRGVELLEERPDARGMPLCVDVERRELQERDEQVPVVRECVREREARGRRRREGDEERRSDVGDLGRCEVLVELLGFGLCLSLGLGLGRGARGGGMEVHVGSGGWARAFLRFAAAGALELQRQSAVILRPHVQVRLQERAACDGDVVDLVGDVLEDGAAGGEVARGAKADLGDAARYGGGTGEARGAHAHG